MCIMINYFKIFLKTFRGKKIQESAPLKTERKFLALLRMETCFVCSAVKRLLKRCFFICPPPPRPPKAAFLSIHSSIYTLSNDWVRGRASSAPLGSLTPSPPSALGPCFYPKPCLNNCPGFVLERQERLAGGHFSSCKP